MLFSGTAEPAALAEAVVARRLNSAIISQPGAGKNTCTVKLLLYGGANQQAEAVNA